MSDASIFEKAIRQLNEKREADGVDYNGKRYSMVKDRVEVFRTIFGNAYGIDTEIDYQRGFRDGEVIVAKAKVIDAKTGYIVASGTAMTFIGFDQVSSTSPIEAVETSAIGRALACFGLHGGEFASGNEMEAIPHKEQAVINRAQNGMSTPGHDDEKKGDTQEYPSDDKKMPDLSPTFGHYMPPKGANLDLAVETGKIADAVVHVKSVQALEQYWTELRDFRDYLNEIEPELCSALKAAFSVRKKSLTGDRT